MSEKTEPPTRKRLLDLRKKGEVPKSNEVASAALFVACVLLLILTGAMLRDRFAAFLTLAADSQNLPFEDAFVRLSGVAWSVVLIGTAPWMLLVIVVAVASLMAQFGFNISFEAIKPSLKKVNPAAGIKKVFSRNNLVETLKSIVKITVLALSLLYVGASHMQDLVRAPQCGLPCVEQTFTAVLYALIRIVLPVFIVVAAADLFYQRHQFFKRNRMSKDEVKREHKDSEGDPLIKGMRRQLHQSLINEGGLQAVRQATVLVTNPVHLAIAVRYDEESTPLPVVIAKAENLAARRAARIAEASGIPVVENVPLAWDLYEQAEIDQYIPRELIPRVADVLRAVQRLAGEAR